MNCFGFVTTNLRPGPGHLARDVEKILQRHRQAVDRRAAHARLAQPVGVRGIGARAVGVDLQECPGALPALLLDARERLLHELAARGPAGVQIGAELRYSPHGEKIACAISSRSSFSAAAASSAAALRGSFWARPAAKSCRVWETSFARVARCPLRAPRYAAAAS